jgi:hypothetical protein
VPDSWEESFDTWSGEDALAEVDREQLLRLARELAERRQAERTEARAEIEQLKQALRERAELVAAHERELVERERLLEERERMRRLPAEMPDVDRRQVVRFPQQPYQRRPCRKQAAKRHDRGHWSRAPQRTRSQITSRPPARIDPGRQRQGRPEHPWKRVDSADWC